jgi:subtilisin family serine protease
MGFNLSHRMLRVTNSGGGGANLSDLTHAARTSADAGDRCASVSYSGVTSSSVRSAGTYCKSQGALLFWAAGNEGQNLNGSRDGDDVLVIGSTTSSDVKSSFSNYGPYVDFMAGGSGIFTTDRSSNTSYASVSGTSFACPMAAGLGALVWSADPTLTPDEVEDLLKATCTDLGTPGIDNTYGYGRIDSKDAMLATGAGPFRFTIDPAPPIIGGSWVDFGIANGEPNMQSAIFYSTKGQGNTQVAPGIFVDLISPKQIPPTKTTNGDGDALWSVHIPNVNIRIFLQGVQANADKTELIWEDIQ